MRWLLPSLEILLMLFALLVRSQVVGSGQFHLAKRAEKAVIRSRSTEMKMCARILQTDGRAREKTAKMTGTCTCGLSLRIVRDSLDIQTNNLSPKHLHVCSADVVSLFRVA